MGGDLSELLGFAEHLADIARGETLKRFRTGIAADDKSGGHRYDPVTEADMQAERAIRDAIEAAYPDHGIFGEEWPDKPANGPLAWSLDPVDGTRSFICGAPNWVTLIALLEEGRPRIGVIDAPVIGERFIGSPEGALRKSHRAEVPLRVSGCTTLAQARLSTTDPYLFEGKDAGAFEAVRRQAQLTRFGHDGYGYALLAGGGLDLVIEAGLKPFDYLALIPVVEAAGGVLRDWAGGTDFAGGKVIAAASEKLLDACLEAMRAA